MSSHFTAVGWLDNLSNCWFQLKNRHVEYIWEKSCCAHQFQLLYHQEIIELLRYHKLFYVAFFLLQIYRKIIVFVNLQRYNLRLEFQLSAGSLQTEEGTGNGKNSFIFRKTSLLGPGSWLWLCGHITGHSQHKSQAMNSFLSCLAFPVGKIASVSSLFLNFYPTIIMMKATY